MAGPYVRAAVDSIQAFLNGNVLMGSVQPSDTSAALEDIVDTITRCVQCSFVVYFLQYIILLVGFFNYRRCKFVHTDAAGDEVVQLFMVETLRCIVKSSSAKCLSDETQWKILQFCFAVLLKSGKWVV